MEHTGFLLSFGCSLVFLLSKVHWTAEYIRRHFWIFPIEAQWSFPEWDAVSGIWEWDTLIVFLKRISLSEPLPLFLSFLSFFHTHQLLLYYSDNIHFMVIWMSSSTCSAFMTDVLKDPPILHRKTPQLCSSCPLSFVPDQFYFCFSLLLFNSRSAHFNFFSIFFSGNRVNEKHVLLLVKRDVLQSDCHRVNACGGAVLNWNLLDFVFVKG